MFKSLREIAANRLDSGSMSALDFYNETRDQAIEICKNVKERFSLRNKNLPFDIIWTNIDLNGLQGPERLQFDFDRTEELALSAAGKDPSEPGISVIAILMWMFDIKKEELTSDPAQTNSRTVSFEKPLLNGELAAIHIGKEILKEGKIVGKVLSAKRAEKEDRDGNPIYLFTARIDEDIWNEVASNPRLLGDVLDFIADSDPAQAVERTISFEKPLLNGELGAIYIGKTLSKDGKIVGKVISASASGRYDKDGNPICVFGAQIDAKADEEIMNSPKLFREALTFDSDSSQEENNLNEVDDMAKKGKGKAQKKAEKKPEEAKAETQEPETSTEENPAVGEEAD